MGKFSGKEKNDAVKHDVADHGAVTQPVIQAKVVKATSVGSIVPSKYAGKYKNGGSDAMATFINDQCVGKDGFEFPAFFQLCSVNGIADAHIAPYREAIASKAHGAQGRARMTLRNRLVGVARKSGALMDLKGAETPIEIPPLPKREKAAETDKAAA